MSLRSVLALLLLAVLPSLALAKQATVTLADGTTLFGEIKSMEYGVFKLDTDHMDVVEIDWESIASFRSHDQLWVELNSGERLLGLVTADSLSLTVGEVDGRTVPRSDVALMGELDFGFWSHVVFAVDLGVNVVRGNNTVTQLSFNGDAGYETEGFETHLLGTVIYNEQQEAPDTRRYTVDFTHNQNLGKKWRGTGVVTLESDENKQLDLRSLVGGTFGRRVVSTARTRLDLMLGVGYLVEDFEDTPQVQSTEGILGGVFRARPLSDDEYDISLIVYPSLNDSGRYRVNADATVRLEFISDLKFSVIIFDQYDSKPPVDINKNDFGLTLGLGWSY